MILLGCLIVAVAIIIGAVIIASAIENGLFSNDLKNVLNKKSSGKMAEIITKEDPAEEFLKKNGK